ncbi:MAG: bactofilin family protein [bacterium]|jgi:cytoskeletal protein CcmA (bactofilin family)
MFKKKGRDEINFDQIDTLIGSGADFQGTLLAQGTLRVDGKVNGEIQIQGDIIIGEKGQVNANVKARNLMLAGVLKGNLQLSGVLEIYNTGKMYGDIVVANLIIAEGATFQGNCTMQVETNDKQIKVQNKVAEATE